jgi:hypothetical protein
MNADKNFGEWNEMRIRQIGARTWVWLNKRAVVEGAEMENYWDRTKPLPAKGPIMLQTHGGEIRWRNIYVHEIDANEAKQSLDASPVLPNPTAYDVSYGPHLKQILHFWKRNPTNRRPSFLHPRRWLARAAGA